MEESSTLAKIHGDIDRLSHLPNNIVETILECLPLRDIVRTKILSHAWRDGLSVVPYLVFDEESFPLPQGQDQNEYDTKFVRIVSRVLLLHTGEIKTFEVSVDVPCCPDIDAWIRHLSRHDVDSFALKIREGSIYKLPSFFFLIKGITYLELCRCIFKLPSSFNGYTKLTALHLTEVIVDGDGIEQLLTLCPLLNQLMLFNMECESLKINHQKLRELYISPTFMNLYLENAPLLALLCVGFSNSGGGIRDSNIVDLLGNVPALRELYIYGVTLQQLSVRSIPVSLPSLHLVSYLCMAIDFGDKHQLLASFCIFRSSVVLEKLDVKAYLYSLDGDISSDDFWQAQEHSVFKFSQLKSVNMDFNGSTSEMKFIEFILANAPSLERMQIKFQENVPNKEQTLAKLLWFPRSSVKARIVAE